MQKLLVAASIVLALLTGGVAGRIITIVTWPVPPTTLKEDTRKLVPVVTISDASNGELSGTLLGEARVFIGSTMAIPNGSGAFRVRATSLLKKISAAPSGMRFVASRRGKKYYPVSSPSGQKLAVENRVYFATAEEAQAAGYQAP